MLAQGEALAKPWDNARPIGRQTRRMLAVDVVKRGNCRGVT